MIAIKDIKEMPSCCYECPYFDDYCALTGKWERDTEQIRDNDCPLVKIITCKDCTNCRSNLVEGITCYWCDKDNCVTSEDFYCANAESEE